MGHLSMHRWGRGALWCLLACCIGLAAMPSRADVLFAVRVLREGGCGGTLPSAPQLHHNATLDRTAEEWAVGRLLNTAADMSGYHAESLAGLHVRGADEAMVQLLRKAGCSTLASQGMHEVGIYRRGFDAWVVLAAEKNKTTTGEESALQLVNRVRASGTKCGSELFGPAPPLVLSGALGGVAFGHANDMATNNYFEHDDLQGKSPSDRVRATGYQEKLVGENIAYGPKSVDDVVKGWLDSPGHCENIMDPRFVEMGIGYATSHDKKQGLYWVQVLATPKTLAAAN
jgi:uncharacterized protein YkwD